MCMQTMEAKVGLFGEGRAKNQVISFLITVDFNSLPFIIY